MFAQLALIAGLSAALAAQQVLRVGVTTAGAPFTFMDPETNTIRGMMVDVIRAVADANGDTVDLQPMQFSVLIPTLTAGGIDVIAAALRISPERQQVVDFSLPIISFGEGLAVAADDFTVYTNARQLAGSTVGAQIGTDGLVRLQQLGMFAEVRVYDNPVDVLKEVGDGRLKGGFANFPTLQYAISHGGYPAVRLVQSYQPMVAGPIALATRKDESGLLAKMNVTLQAMQTDGRLAAILAKWQQ
jgi:polar amino acid transport system substrate-binding protein